MAGTSCGDAQLRPFPAAIWRFQTGAAARSCDRSVSAGSFFDRRIVTAEVRFLKIFSK